MENLLDWGIDVVLWFQQFSPALDLPFKGFTFLGNKEFFLLFMPFIYWCVDRRCGARLFILFLLSAYINAVAKGIVAQPRPFQYDLRVKKIVSAGGGGLPSGHTQNAMVVWGYLAHRFRQPWVWVLCALLMIAIPLSRMYLGVHFPTDLMGGYLLGAILLLLFLRVAPRVEVWLVKQGTVWQLTIALVLSTGLMILNPAVEADAIRVGATLMGIASGMVMERRWVGFCSGGVWWKQLLRYILGIAILFGLWGGLRAGFSDLQPAVFFIFIRYVLVGLWGGLGAPWLFVRLRLAEKTDG